MNTLKTQAKTNKMIIALLTINKIKHTHDNDRGVLIGRVLLTSMKDARAFIEHMNNL